MSLPYRDWLMRSGMRLSTAQFGSISGVAKYLEMGFRMRQVGWRCDQWVEKREELFDIVGRAVGDRDVLYLEFGVFQGEATRYWSKLLKNPQSKLHGFDSFEGLPEDWAGAVPKGHFSTNGALPVIDDPRVKFFKGWFDQTLPAYEVPKHDVLVLNFDADLYSSTKTALDRFSSFIVPGTYLYFDEFSNLHEEFRAFWDFCSASQLKFELLAAQKALSYVLFRCIA